MEAVDLQHSEQLWRDATPEMTNTGYLREGKGRSDVHHSNLVTGKRGGHSFKLVFRAR